jgi:hypothetical protein
VGGRRLEVTAFHTIARWVFALRIRMLSYYRRKPPACLPVTVYKAGSILPPAHHAPALPHRSPAGFVLQVCIASRRRRSSCRLAHILKQPRRRSAIERRQPMRTDAGHALAQTSRTLKTTGVARGLTWPHLSRLPTHARNSCGSEALRSTREFLAKMIDGPPTARATCPRPHASRRPDAAPIPCVHFANSACQ